MGVQIPHLATVLILAYLLGLDVKFSLNSIEGVGIFVKEVGFLTLKLSLVPSCGNSLHFYMQAVFPRKGSTCEAHVPSKEGEGQMFFPPMASPSDLESNS